MKNHLITTKHQQKYRDHLFIAIFGRNNPQSKKWRLELYNALNNTNYTDPDALHVNTIENIIYITMHNDVSFLVDSQMTLYEHQSSPNPNMPLRELLYFAQLYQTYIDDTRNRLISENLVKIPNPNFIVFYNGKKERPEQYELKLSDAFICKDDSKKFEWTAKVININENYNLTLQKKCKPLYDYVRFVSRISRNKETMSLNDAINEAVDWAIKEDLLEGFFRKQKQEIIAMCLTEYDEEACIKTWQEDGYIRGIQEKAVEDAVNALKLGLSPEQISKITSLPVEQILELQKKVMVKA